MKVNSRPAAVPGNQRRPRGREAGVEERPVQVQDMWIREAARPQRLPGEEDEDCRWPADTYLASGARWHQADDHDGHLRHVRLGVATERRGCL